MALPGCGWTTGPENDGTELQVNRDHFRVGRNLARALVRLGRNLIDFDAVLMMVGQRYRSVDPADSPRV